LRTSGRTIVTTVTGPSCSVLTVSVMSAPYVARTLPDMPEGDTLRRLAAKITARFAGDRVVRSTMRDPRLVGVDLTGTTLLDADAYGKHLFVRFDDGRSLHAHLSMTGSFTVGPT